MTIQLKDVSTKRCLISMAEHLEASASVDKVDRRRDAMLRVAEGIRKLAESRAVSTLLDYME